MGTGSPDALPRLPPRGVITKAGGAAGDAAAGVLDPAAPPRGWAVSKLLWWSRSDAIDRYRFPTLDNPSQGAQICRRPLPLNGSWATCFPFYCSLIF